MKVMIHTLLLVALCVVAAVASAHAGPARWPAAANAAVER